MSTKYSHTRHAKQKERLRTQIRREVWYASKVIGKAAWSWARAQPPVKRQLDRLETAVEEVKQNAREKIAGFEKEFWNSILSKRIIFVIIQEPV